MIYKYVLYNINLKGLTFSSEGQNIIIPLFSLHFKTACHVNLVKYLVNEIKLFNINLREIPPRLSQDVAESHKREGIDF